MFAPILSSSANEIFPALRKKLRSEHDAVDLLVNGRLFRETKYRMDWRPQDMNVYLQTRGEATVLLDGVASTMTVWSVSGAARSISRRQRSLLVVSCFSGTSVLH